MKTFVRLFQIVAVICILTACDSCGGPDYPSLPFSTTDPYTVSFSSDFTTSFSKSIISKGSYPDLNDPVCQLVQEGSGANAELGAFYIYLSCCWSLVDGLHNCTEGIITDAYGNTLSLVFKDGDNGEIFTSDFPYDKTLICSEFEFTIGTGRFEGASGGGLINCDVKGTSNIMLHHWEVMLTLME
ncbi:MAG: hypothetical protein E4G92_01575 [Bacteroidia bacterium]|nr:MAG: hypothetical protein E4G92_01575 [Bacteroidia bacterium]